MKEIYYTPKNNASNLYCARMQECLSEYGEIKAIDKRKIIKNIFLFNRLDVLIVNWIENDIVNNKGDIHLKGVLKVLIYLFIYRILFKKFIFVRHNNYPHHCKTENAVKVARFINVLEKIPHHVIVHSLPSATNGRFYVPHPLYVKVSKKEAGLLNTGCNHYVIFGRIVRYKKIEEVIVSFPAHLKLIVAGKCDDELYLLELKKLIEGKQNIEIISDFLSDEQAKQLILKSQGVLLTHNDNDMIVSGSFFYAMSIRSKVYSLRTPFFSWVENEMGRGYIEVFDELHQMLSRLSSSDENFKNEFKKSPNELFGDDIVVAELGKILG